MRRDASSDPGLASRAIGSAISLDAAIEASREEQRTATLASAPTLAAPAAELLRPGDRLASRYEVLERLGGGGFGVVYRARDERLGREVALKVLRAERTEESALRRFKREAALAREVSSPNVVSIYDFGIERGLHYLVLEYLPEGTLRTRIARGPIAIEEAVRITAGLLAGLSALHARGILHRDVKPSNVLFTIGGEPRLVDLGLALPVGEDLTRSLGGNAFLGTADYVAPERALTGNCDDRSDLYSVGVVLFEMLTGRIPFPASDSVTAILKRCRQAAPAVRRIRPDVPRWLARFVARLLETQPAFRFPSAAAALRALERRRVLHLRRPALLLGAVLLSASAIGTLIALRAHERSRFAHVRAVSASGVDGSEAVDRAGRVLWTREDISLGTPQYSALARIAGEPGPRLVAVLRRSDQFDRASYGALRILDPQSGVEVRSIEIPHAEGLFPGMSERYFPLTIDAVDLDRDGFDEVVATFAHGPSWPGFAILWEPRLDRVRIVFVAAGHHSFVGAHDLDRDGAPELLFLGYNSLLGRYPSLVAVHPTPPIGTDAERRGSQLGTVFTPGLYWLRREEAPTLWSRLLPRGEVRYGPSGLEVVPERHTLRVLYSDHAPIEVAFDGEDPERGGDRVRASRLRQEVYDSLNESRRLAAAEAWLSAIDETGRAASLAAELGDPVLLECAERLGGAALVGAGRFDEAEAHFARLSEPAEAASEVAFTAAEAFHLAGQLERALAWYRKGLVRGGEYRGGGRFPAYFLEGIVFALGELGRWDEAARECERFGATYPVASAQAGLLGRFVRERLGLPAGAERIDSMPMDLDTNRLLVLEARRARGDDTAELLLDLRAELDFTSETRGAVWSLIAVVLASQGELEDARSAASEGVAQLAALARRSVPARGLLPLARERLGAVEAAMAATGSGAEPAEPARDSQPEASR